MNMQEWFAKLANDFAQTFITKDRWQLFAKGFTVTIRVAILALLMGIAIGVLAVSYTHLKYEITLYTSCCNLNRGIYYYTTYELSLIRI